MLLDTTSVPAAEQPREEIVDPTTGEVVDSKDADALVGAFERVKAQIDQAQDAKRRIVFAITALTEDSGTKTRRLRGAERLAKIEMPDDTWDQSVLKEAWNSYPNLRDEFLGIATIKVRLREFKKLLGTSGPPDVEQFKKMVVSANRGPGQTPSVTVEK